MAVGRYSCIASSQRLRPRGGVGRLRRQVTLAGNAPMEHGLQPFIDKRVGALAGHEERLIVRPEERGDGCGAQRPGNTHEAQEDARQHGPMEPTSTFGQNQPTTMGDPLFKGMRRWHIPVRKGGR